MIHSMTGFACISAPTASGAIHWEIRSINHRYLDLHFHLPERWRELEAELRPLLQQAFSRGKMDIYLHGNTETSANIQLNISAIKSLAETYQQLQHYLPQMTAMTMAEVLEQPGVRVNDKNSNNEMKNLLFTTFKEALVELAKQREREGATLGQFLKNKLSEILDKLKRVKPRREQVLLEQREKFMQRISGLQHPFDPHRLEQELLIWAQKSDINEEIERLETHINEALKILTQGGKTIGRQLDFLLQEILREANTLASKSTDILLTNTAVDIKVYLEQIREQLQNIA